jgi:hypothetical protein
MRSNYSAGISAPLALPAATGIQEVASVLLHYARAVDITTLVSLGSIASAKHTASTAAAATQLLNNAASHPDGTVRFHASDRVLHVAFLLRSPHPDGPPSPDGTLP